MVDGLTEERGKREGGRREEERLRWIAMHVRENTAQLLIGEVGGA